MFFSCGIAKNLQCCSFHYPPAYTFPSGSSTDAAETPQQKHPPLSPLIRGVGEYTAKPHLPA